VVYLSSSMHMTAYYLKQAKTASAQILYNLPFTIHLTSALYRVSKKNGNVWGGSVPKYINSCAVRFSHSQFHGRPLPCLVLYDC
jgi:hypothetical protein